MYRLITRFRSYLCSIAKARNASDAGISVSFLQIFFLCLLDIRFRGFVFECDLDQTCHTYWCLRPVSGQEM